MLHSVGASVNLIRSLETETPVLGFSVRPYDSACLVKSTYTGAILWFCEKQVSRVSWRGSMSYHIPTALSAPMSPTHIVP